MMVHKKLMNARMMLQQTELKKSGHNKFSNYYYFELGDFLPQINQIFHTLGLCGVISYTKDYADLTITDVDDGTFITISSPMVEANLKGAHAIQNLGAVETYQRRYLWMTAMEIVEHDALDSSAPLKEEKVIITPTQGIADTLPPEEMEYLRELAIELMTLDGKQGLEKMEAENLEADQKVALWGLLPSKVRSSIKKAKEV